MLGAKFDIAQIENTVELALSGLESKVIDDEMSLETAHEEMDKLDDMLADVNSKLRCGRITFNLK